VPVHGHGDVTTTCDGLRGTIEALEDLDGPATTAEIGEHDAVQITPQVVRHHLETLRETGAVKTSPDPEDGRRDVHTLTDAAGITPGGVVTLPDVTAETGRGSCEDEPYSNTIGNVFPKSDGGTPTEEGDTPTDEQDEPAALDYPAMAAEPDDGTDWELTRRVIGMPDAEDGGG
jgi:DNA-binding transcriptional ArsR family regulator